MHDAHAGHGMASPPEGRGGSVIGVWVAAGMPPLQYMAVGAPSRATVGNTRSRGQHGLLVCPCGGALPLPLPCLPAEVDLDVKPTILKLSSPH